MNQEGVVKETLLYGKVYKSVALGKRARDTWQKEIEAKEIAALAAHAWDKEIEAKEIAAFAAQIPAFATSSGVDWESCRPTKRSPRSRP
jgi:hypothetical protein